MGTDLPICTLRETRPLALFVEEEIHDHINAATPEEHLLGSRGGRPTLAAKVPHQAPPAYPTRCLFDGCKHLASSSSRSMVNRFAMPSKKVTADAAEKARKASAADLSSWLRVP